MNKASVGATILWWMEAIVSIRVLLFTIPVLINKQMTAASQGSGGSDWFILLLTVAAALFLAVGLLSIFGHKLAQIFHFLAAGVVVAMTIGLVMQSSGSAAGVSAGHFIPSVVAIIFAGLAFFLTKNVQTQ